MDNELLNVEDLTVSYDRYDSRAPYFSSKRVYCEVLHGLSLHVRVGEVLAIVGASGSGKSVLAGALLGLFEPNSRVSGQIRFEGEELSSSDFGRLRGHEVAFVPQGVESLDPLMPVGRQVRGLARGRTRAERLADKKRRRLRQRELFRAYGLPASVERCYSHELSGGMARRILFMSALMGDPKLIIADEPTPGMDGEQAVRAVEDLRSFADSGGAVVLITHDLELGMRVADRVAVFRDGAIVEEAPVSRFDVPERLAHSFARSLALELMALREDANRPLQCDDHGAEGHAVLQAEGITFGYTASKPVFANLSLTLGSGERLALLGPSGAGKTTLCKVLAGYLKPTSGHVRIDGTEIRAIDGLHRHASRSAFPVQLVAQHPESAFDPNLAIRRSLSETGDPDGDRGMMLRSEFGVNSAWLDRMPHELSGGELMRLCLVRALMVRPRVLICDEVTAMLDVVTQAKLWSALMDMQAKERFGLIFVSHSRAIVNRVATRVLSLE